MEYDEFVEQMQELVDAYRKGIYARVITAAKEEEQGEDSLEDLMDELDSLNDIEEKIQNF